MSCINNKCNWQDSHRDSEITETIDQSLKSCESTVQSRVQSSPGIAETPIYQATKISLFHKSTYFIYNVSF